MSEPPLVARTKSVDDTRMLAAETASLARPGDIVLLAGGLGTGKTAFVQGFAKGLGVTSLVTSPTFTLVRPYTGRLRLLHADIYRLDRLQEVIDLALLEQLDDRAVACIEWGNMAQPLWPADYLEVSIDWVADSEAASEAASEDERMLRLSAVGQAWSLRLPALRVALGQWLVLDA